MKNISDIEFSAVARLTRNKPANHAEKHVDVGSDGLPVDRTICSWCFGREPSCRKCEGTGLVCPTCRGGRRLRTESIGRPVYIACHDCTDWIDQHKHHWTDHNDPLFQRVTGREAGAIQQYWRNKNREANDACV